jgi:hypothetical protein
MTTTCRTAIIFKGRSEVKALDPIITLSIFKCSPFTMEIVDFNRFLWRNDEKVPGRLYREAGGGEVIEDIWKLMKHGEQNLFLGVYATLSAPISQTELFTHAKSAWKSLRWEVPTIAASTSHIWHEGKAPTTFITYDLGKSTEDVNAWAEETVKIFPEYHSKTLDDLRYDVGQEPIPANDFDRQTFLYLVPFSAHKFGLLLHTAHTTFDGAGVKILLTKLLGHLAKYITDPGYLSAQEAGMAWGSEGDRLLPIVTEILKKRESAVIDDQGNVIKAETAEEYRGGKEYFETLGDVMTGFATGAPVGPRLCITISCLPDLLSDDSKISRECMGLNHSFHLILRLQSPRLVVSSTSSLWKSRIKFKKPVASRVVLRKD